MKNLFKLVFFITASIIVNFARCQDYKSDSLHLASLTDPEKRFYFLEEMAYKYIRDAEKSHYFVKEALSLSKVKGYDIGWRLMVAKSWMMLSVERWESADSCIIVLSESLRAKDTSKDNREKLYHISYLNLNLLKYLEASKNLEKLLNISEVTNDSSMVGRSYLGLARIAHVTREFDLEKKYLDDYLEYLKNDTSKTKGRVYKVYTENSISRGEYNEALEKLELAKNIFQSNNDTISIATVNNTMAWVYNALKKPYKGIQFYYKSIAITEKSNNDKLSADSYGNLGSIFFDLKQYDSAILYFEKIREIALKYQNNNHLMFSYMYLANTYDSLGDYRNAYLNFKEYSNVFDSVRNKEIEQIYIQEKTKFETERKEKELEILSLKFRKNQLILYSSIGFATLIVILAILIYRQNKLKSQKRIAEFKKQMAEIKQKSLRQQMNPHFVFNTLNSIQYFMFQNDKMATNNYMSKFAMLVRKTLENSIHNSVALKHELEVLELYVELEQLRFKNSFTCNIEIDDELDLLQHKIPAMIIQPFVENSINHGLHIIKENGMLNIILKLIDNQLIECIVEDNGIGRAKAEQIKKAKGKNHNSLGTSITEERLKIINSLTHNKVKVEYFDLKDQNYEAAGTKVVIHIPIIL